MRFFYCALLLVLTISCQNDTVNRTKLIHYIPENASLIIKTHNIESLKSSLQNNDFFETLAQNRTFNNLEDKLETISLLDISGEVLICFSKDPADSLQYTLVTKFHKTLFPTDSLKNYKEEILSYKDQSITKSTLQNETFYSTVLDSIFIVSSSKDLLDASFKKVSINTELEKIYNTTSTDRTLSIILNSNQSFIKSFFLDKGLPFNTFTHYLAVDVDIDQNQIFINGITQSTDSLNNSIRIFKNTVPQENHLATITPSQSDGFMSFTFNNFKTLQTNLLRFTQKDTITDSNTLFDNINEVGLIYEGESRAIVLNAIDIIATNDALLGEQNTIETYREIEIFAFSRPDLFANTFDPLITFNNATKYCVLDTFFVFADDIEMLHTIIAQYQNKTTLSEQSYFKDIHDQLNDASSLMIVGNPRILQTILEKNLEDTLRSDLSHYNASALQFIYDANFAHVNGIIKRTKIKASEHTISEELHIKLDTDLLNNPQFVTNHITKEKEIAVQDIKNNLYLISTKGKILWKKQLEGPILGTIEQIDIYKNGRLQLTFATPHRVYVIDRNGKDVAPFPGKFNDIITQPLAVFDYDKNKNYRLLVTQGKQVLMYDVTANIVRGFTFKSANDIIINQPQHIRLSGKDYITMKTQNRLYILDRTGKTRISPKTTMVYSNEPVFLYNDKITTTHANGNLISVDPRGNTSVVNLNLNDRHHIDASNKTLVTLSENRLSIKGKTLELDFGSYTLPKLFYIQDKIYVSVTDLQAHKVYLFDSQGTLLPNFPVYGNSIAMVDSIDKNKNIGFVVKGDPHAVILYKIY